MSKDTILHINEKTMERGRFSDFLNYLDDRLKELYMILKCDIAVVWFSFVFFSIPKIINSILSIKHTRTPLTDYTKVCLAKRTMYMQVTFHISSRYFCNNDISLVKNSYVD